MNSVAVLLSTYNGEKYLEEQIKSILNQKGVNIKLVVRDDGSSDNTLKILEKFSESELLTYYSGENLNVKKSFLDLLKNCGYADYYAFCDQDDYWKENKLIRAINILGNAHDKFPKLYFSNVTIVNENLDVVGKNGFNSSVFSLKNIVVKNNAIGCTMVFNNELKKIVNKVDYRVLNDFPLHDHWIYMLCLAMDGKVMYDTESSILYRQHESNIVGNRTSVIQKIKDSGIFDNDCIRYKQVCELLEFYSEILPKKNLLFLKSISKYKRSWKNKKFLLSKEGIKSDNIMNSIIIKFLILLNKF